MMDPTKIVLKEMAKQKIKKSELSFTMVNSLAWFLDQRLSSATIWKIISSYKCAAEPYCYGKSDLVK